MFLPQWKKYILFLYKKIECVRYNKKTLFSVPFKPLSIRSIENTEQRRLSSTAMRVYIGTTTMETSLAWSNNTWESYEICSTNFNLKKNIWTIIFLEGINNSSTEIFKMAE